MAETQSFILEAIDRASAPLRRVSEAFGRVSAAAEQMGARAGRAASGVGKTFDEMADAAQRSGAKMRDVGASLTLGLTAPLVGAGALATKVFSEYEFGLTGLQKASGLTKAEVEDLGQVFRDMATTEMPMSANELIAIATEGSKIGLATDALERYTRTVGMIGSAFDLSAEDTAEAISSISNQFGILNALTGEMDFSRLDTVANVVNNLADGMATSEGKLLATMDKIAGLSAMKITENQAASLAAAFTSLGMRSDVAGTAINNMAGKLSAATSLEESKIEALNKLGFDAMEIQQRMAAGEGFQVIVDVLEKAKAAGTGALPLMNAIFGLEVGDELTRAASGVDQLTKAHSIATDTIAGNGATIQDSFKLMSGTTQNEFKMLKNATIELVLIFGQLLAEAVLPLAKGLRQALIAMSEFGRENPGLAKVVVSILAIAAAIGPVVFAIGTVQGAFAALGVFLSGGFGAALVGVTAIGGSLAVGVSMFVQFSAGVIAAILKFTVMGSAHVLGFAIKATTAIAQFAIKATTSLIQFAAQAVAAIARFVASSIISLAKFAAQGTISIAKFVAKSTLSLAKFAVQAAITFAPLLIGAAAFAAAGYLVYKNWDSVSEVLSRAELPKSDSAKLSAKIGIEVENSADIVEALFQRPIETISAISSAYLGVFQAMWQGFWSNLTSSIQMIGLNIQFQLTSWGVAFSAFVAGIASWVTSLGASVTAVFAGIVAAFAALQASAIAKASEIATTIVNAFEGIRATFNGLREGAIAKVAEIRDAITNALDSVKSQIQSALSSIPNPFANLRMPSLSRGGSVGNSAQGNIPQSAAGLLSAAQREARAMPPGSALTVANTSELILNRAQYGSLLSQRARPIAIAQRENQIASATFAPTINLNVAQTGQVDPRQIAKQVMAELDREYRQWSAGMA